MNRYMANGRLAVVAKILFSVFLAIAGTELSFAQSEPDFRGDRHFLDGSISTGSGYHSITGRINRTVTDLVVPGSVGTHPLVLQRTMRNWASSNRGDPVHSRGPGEEAVCSAQWFFNTNQYSVHWSLIGSAKDHAVYLQYPDGTEDKKAGDPSGVYTFGSGDRLYFQGYGNVQVLVLQDGSKVYFNNGVSTNYRGTTSVVDPYGLATTYQISTNASGAVQQQTTDASGRWIRITYTSNNNGSWPIHAETSSGDFVDYTWDFSAPAGTIFPYNPEKLLEAHYADGTVAHYEYISNSHGVFPYRCYDVRAASKMRSVEYNFNQNLSNWGDSYQNHLLGLFPLLDERLPYSSTPVSSRTEIAAGAAPNHGVKETRGDGASRIIVPMSSMNRTGSGIYSETDFLSNESFHSKTSTETYTDPLGHVTQWDYVLVGPNAADVIENPIKITFADGSSKQFIYTDIQNPYYIQQVTDELGRATTYDRYANGFISQINYPDGSNEGWNDLNGYNQPTAHRLKNGSYEYFEYDSAGRLKKHTLPTGDVTTFTYYADGHPWADRLATMTDPRGNTTTYEYDLLFVGDAQSGTPCAGRGLTTKIINADGTYKSFGYDIYGNKIWEENELRQRTSYTYDDYNRLRTATNPLGQKSETRYGDTDAEALAHTYNAPQHVYSPSGKLTSFSYDANKRPVLKAEADQSADVKYWRYEYDAVGNLKKLREQAGGSSGSEVFRDTTYDYDVRYRKITESAPLNRITEFGYDAAGNVKWTHFADGTYIWKDYDAMNRMIRSTDEMGRTTNYIYYPSGKVQWIIDPNNNSYSYWYDTVDRITHFWLTNAGQTGFDYEQTIYDAAGNIASVRNRSGSWKSFTYDSRNREKTSSWNDGITPSTSTDYDAAGRVVQRSNSTSTLNYTFNAAGQLIEERQAIAGGPLSVLTYEYDADGNRTRMRKN